MDPFRSGRLNALLLFLFPVVLIVGMVIGFRMRDTLLRRNESLERIVDLVNAKYVDTISSTKLYNDAAEGLLKCGARAILSDMRALHTALDWL